MRALVLAALGLTSATGFRTLLPLPHVSTNGSAHLNSSSHDVGTVTAQVLAHDAKGNISKVKDKQKSVPVQNAAVQKAKVVLKAKVATRPPWETPDDYSKTGYTKDTTPKAAKVNFGHPFPILQEPEDYDKDFVKDVDDDHGEWKVQTEYDRARLKLAKEKDDVAKALAREIMENDEYHNAQKNEHDAEEQAKRATGDADRARHEADDVKTQADGVVGPRSQAERDVESAKQTLEGCKAALEAAQARLKELQALKAGRWHRKSKADEMKKLIDDEVTKDNEDTSAKLEVEGKEKGEHDNAANSYSKEYADVERAEAELAKAAERLRQYRHGAPGADKFGVGPNGVPLPGHPDYDPLKHGHGGGPPPSSISDAAGVAGKIGGGGGAGAAGAVPGQSGASSLASSSPVLLVTSLLLIASWSA